LHPDPPPLVCIEEPELGLHPDVIQPLAKLLLNASKRMQLVVTTHSDDKSNCRKAFATFFAQVVPAGSFKVIASGSRRAAFEDFCLALQQHADKYIVLVVDSETEVTVTPWRHLADRGGDKWSCPSPASDEQAHLMVQIMESWFLADHEMISAYYGQGFLQKSLPRRKRIEKIDKAEVLKSLRNASRNTQKGPYHKTIHGFELLELVRPRLVRKVSPHADRLFKVLERETQNRGSSS
jgi:hypothetical protein